DALVAAYQVSGDSEFLKEAVALAEIVIVNYREPKSGMIRNRESERTPGIPLTHASEAQAIYDQPMPALQAQAALAMRALARITSNDRYDKFANDLIAPLPAIAGSVAGSMLGTVGLALEDRADEGAAVIIAVKSDDRRADAMFQAAIGVYRPGKTLSRISSNAADSPNIRPEVRAMVEAVADRGAPLAFVCAGKACSTPAATPEQLREALEHFKVAELAKSLAVPLPPSAASLATTSP